MNINNLPIGTIFISNNTRLMIVGYNKNNQGGYLVCACNENEVITTKLYTLLANQIEKVLSLGYVDILENNNNVFTNPFKNNVVPTQIPNQNNQTNNTNQGTGKFIFDENGFVIGEQ